jgi:hypothetical protein
MSAKTWLTSIALATLLSGCADDRSDRGGSAAASCNSGVAIVLEGFSTRFSGNLPVGLTACFDADCDVVRIVSSTSTRSGIACAWDPGGPQTQLTSCRVRDDGAVEIDIARVDGRDYGARHVVAVSVTATDKPLYSHGAEVRLVGSPDSACFVSSLDLRPLPA